MLSIDLWASVARSPVTFSANKKITPPSCARTTDLKGTTKNATPHANPALNDRRGPFTVGTLVSHALGPSPLRSWGARETRPGGLTLISLNL